MPANSPIIYHRFRNGTWETSPAQVIFEAPVSITINGEVWLTLMCTPTDLEALAVGFAFNEGLLRRRDEIAALRVCPAQDNVDLWLNHAVTRPKDWSRTSGCGGAQTAAGDASGGEQTAYDLRADDAPLPPERLLALMAELYHAQELYRETGGVHTSALSDGERLCLLAEDIGRHNTLDKLAGRLLLDEPGFARRALLTTGRISSEMLQKAARMGVPLVASRTSPSSLSVRLAERWGITLVGYARRDGFSVYAHPQRIGGGL